MLGFSLGKLLLLAAILFGVWYAFRHIGRLDRERRESLQDKVKRAAGRPRTGERSRESVQETVRCTVCDVFVPAGAANCGRPDCPY